MPYDRLFGRNKIKQTCFVPPHFAPVAQLVEQLPFKEKVAGS